MRSLHAHHITNLSARAIIVALALPIILCGAVYVASSDSVTIALNGVQSVTGPDSVCKKITNGSPTGLSLYTPTTSTAEWQSFYSNPPTGVSMSACTAPLHCWGSNTYGEVGDGTVTSRTTPKIINPPSGVTNFTSVASAQVSACALGSNGQVYCWGYNGNCALGDGTTTNHSSPATIQNPPGVTSYSDLTSGHGHLFCAKGNNGVYYCWGSVAYAVTVTKLCTPTAMPLPSGVSSYKKVIGGIWTICGLDYSGKAYCWGMGSSGEFGDSTTTMNSSTPRPVSMPPGITFTDIDTGGWMVCALGSNGYVYCWGNGKNGSLGNGAVANRSTPTSVTMPAGITSFTKMTSRYSGATNGSGGCAIANTGDLYCWGSNVDGQIGDGTTTNRLTPTLVTKPSGVTSFLSVHAGTSNVCAIGNNDVTYCWGKDILGRGTTGTTSTVPVAISMPTGVIFTAVTDGSSTPICAL